MVLRLCVRMSSGGSDRTDRADGNLTKQGFNYINILQDCVLFWCGMVGIYLYNNYQTHLHLTGVRRRTPHGWKLRRMGRRVPDSLELGRMRRGAPDTLELGRVGRRTPDGLELGRVGRGAADRELAGVGR